jgi:23S rRNA (uracil1939-C5)-methyltransferase
VLIPEVAPAPRRLGYRARVKLVVRNTKGEPAIGLYVPGSHRVMDISSCPVHPQAVNQVIGFLKKKIQEFEIVPYDERNDSGQLRYLDFRYSFAQQELCVTLVTRNKDFPQGGLLARSLRRRFSFISGVVQNINPQKGNVIFGAEYRTLAGQDTLVERIGFLKIGYSVGVFSQANPFTARRLYEEVMEVAALRGHETALDLYCGVGPISLHVAGSARQVWGIDDSEASIATAKQNARRNGIGNCRFIAGDVAQKLNETRQNMGAIDLITVNPPRKGVQPAALDALLAVGASKIIYVSCEPNSLARDLDRMTNAGYQVQQVQSFDMFPQTEEVETVALLVQK